MGEIFVFLSLSLQIWAVYFFIADKLDKIKKEKTND